MAEKTTKKGGSSNTATTWTPEVVVQEGDICTAAAFALTWNSTVKAQSLTLNTGSTLTATTALKIGTGVLPASGVLLSISSGASLGETAGLVFSPAAATPGTIATGGKKWNSSVTFTTGKSQLLSAVSFGEALGTPCKIEGSAELDLNGNNLETILFEVLSTSTLKGTSSTIKLRGAAAGNGIKIAETTTVTGSPSVEFTEATSPTNERLFAGGSKTYGTVTFVTFTKVEGSNTASQISLNNKAKPTTCKGTLTALSNHLVVTEGEANLFAKAEVAASGIPLGTTLVKKIEAGVWEMSANATETVLVAEVVTIYNPGVTVTEGTTQTVTTLACNGTEAEPARVCSTVAGKAWTLKLPAGNTQITAVARIKDMSVPEGSVLYVPNSTNLGGNNANVRFEAEPTSGHPLAMML